MNKTAVTMPAPCSSAARRFSMVASIKVAWRNSALCSLTPSRQRPLDLVERRFDLVGGRQGVGAEGFGGGAEHQRDAAVQAGVAALGGRAKLHLGHLGDRNGAAAAHRDDGMAQVFQRGDAPAPSDDVFLVGSFQHAARQIEVGGLDGLDDLLQGEVVRLEFAGRHDHLILLDAAADADHRGDARHRQQAVADVPLADGAQVEFRHRAVVAFVGEAVLQEAAHNGRHRQHDGRLDAGRKLLLGLPQALGDLLARHGEIGAPLEHRHDGGQPDDGRRAHADHVGGAVQGGLDGQGKQRFHLFRRKARRLRQDDHLRRREVREHVEVDIACRHDAGNGGDDDADHDHQPVFEGPLNESAEHWDNPVVGRFSEA